MVMQVIVNLPEETYRRARRLAQLTQRNLTDVLADTLDLSLPALGEDNAPELKRLTDDQILALTELRLSDEDGEQLSELLYNQQADQLTLEQRPELARLMQIYQEGLLLKAEALVEAVSRGLIPPLS